ncbi:uncharacterized protein V1518DRAFT_415954 [Limtongia smithiae]|uniref:uncharacterized protein n=1 Tax=Limtongia smithiae TaxID=1125753 RepID=UPI0034CE625B
MLDEEPAEPSPTVCHAEACAIQDCLRRRNFSETRCAQAIDALYACCARMYDADSSARAIACPQPHLLRLKLQQRAQEQQSKR